MLQHEHSSLPILPDAPPSPEAEEDSEQDEDVDHLNPGARSELESLDQQDQQNHSHGLNDIQGSADALENLALEEVEDCSKGSGNSQSSCNTLDEVDNNLDQLDDSQPYLDPLTVRLATKKKGKRQDNVGTGLAPGRSDAQPVRHRRVVSAQLQIILVALAIMAVIALFLDWMLVSAGFAR